MLSINDTLCKPSIRISALRKSYGDTVILNGIDLEVAAGTYLCLLGPSGCGKTTLLRCIAGLEHPGSGQLDLQGKSVFHEKMPVPVPAEKRGLGMVFQHYALWPHMKVFDNIAFPMRQKRASAGAIETRVSDLADLIGLRPLLDRFPGQLSGGQQQRVALARALCIEPSILLLDEPLSNLDSGLRNQLRRELRNIHDRLGMTSVMVTHDQTEAMALADMVAVLHQGVVVQYGRPAEVLFNPATRYVAGFVGYDNMPEGIVTDLADGSVTLDFDGARVSVQASGRFAVGERLAIGLRSRDVSLTGTPRGNHIAATVSRVTRLGPSLEIEITAAGRPLLVTQPADAGPAPKARDHLFLQLPDTAPLLR